MDEPSTSRLIWYLPQVAAATLLVGVFPIFAAWEVRSAGWIDSVLLSGLFGLALAFGVSYIGGLIWSSRSGSGDLLFSELMLWGWLRRLWIERRFDSTLRRLEGIDDGELDRERRGELLAELAVALEARDPYTHGHSHRVARHATTIAKRMGLSRHEVDDVRAAAMLHDIGKLSTPNDVLRKQERLNDDEFDVIKQHSARGAEMVSKLHNDRLTAMVLHHHERLDGSGYPAGLSGNQIPLGARIIAVADTFDAITSTRPYRRARSHRAAIGILNEDAGTHLDPAAVRAFESHYSGRRPLAIWVAFTDVPGQLISWLGSGVSGAAGPVSRAVATAAVTGAATVTAVAGTEPRATADSFSRQAADTAALSAGGWREAVSSATAGARVFAVFTQAGLLAASEQEGPASSVRGAVIGDPVAAAAVQDLLPVGTAQPGDVPLTDSAGQADAGGSTGLDGGGTALLSGVQIPEAGGGALTPGGEMLSGTQVDTQAQDGGGAQNQSPSDTETQTPGTDQTQPSSDGGSGGATTGPDPSSGDPTQGAGVGAAGDTTTPPATAAPPDTTAPPATTPPADTATLVDTQPPADTEPPADTPVDTQTPADTQAPADTQTPTADQDQGATAGT